jgi:predicted nucleic-acid-binding protein
VYYTVNEVIFLKRPPCSRETVLTTIKTHNELIEEISEMLKSSDVDTHEKMIYQRAIKILKKGLRDYENSLITAKGEWSFECKSRCEQLKRLARKSVLSVAEFCVNVVDKT